MLTPVSSIRFMAPIMRQPLPRTLHVQGLHERFVTTCLLAWENPYRHCELRSVSSLVKLKYHKSRVTN